MKIDLNKYMEAPLGIAETQLFLTEICSTFKKYKVDFNNVDDVLLLIKDAAYANLCGYGDAFKSNSEIEKPVKKSIFTLF